MGCHCAKTEKLAPDLLGEDTVMVHEMALGFSTLPATTIATEVRVFSHRGKNLNGKQLKDMLMALKLPYSLVDVSGSPLNAFFSQFLENKHYSAKKLGTLGVLLGNGTVGKKAEVLFSLYESESTGYLENWTVRTLVQIACEIALVTLPKYTEMELVAFKETEGLRKHAKYAEKLTSALHSTIETITADVLQGAETLKEAEFVTMIVTNAKHLLNSHELRLFAMKVRELQGISGLQRIPVQANHKHSGSGASVRRSKSSEEQLFPSDQKTDASPLSFRDSP